MEQKIREQLLKNNKDNNRNNRILATDPGDEIVIGGVAGRFPNSKDVAEFRHNLYNKVDMVDNLETRWRHFSPEIPQRMGKISDLEKFDATFFGVHFKQAHTMDPQCRLLIERAYECIIDAGVNPKTLRGSRTGVFIGACFAESEKTWFYEKISSAGFGITGCARAMLANRISYCLGLQGPSVLVDTACSSSMYALDLAFNAFRNGEIDAAIIGGANLLLHPYVTLQFARLGVLASNGFCLPFDNNASGYTRSESICTIFLQRRKNAIRSYGTILYSKTNCDGYKEEGITYPSGEVQRKLLQEFYEDLKLDPSNLNYVEAHSTGTVVGDPEECAALDKIFCKNRKKPLLVGSVKSNLGHTESTSGIVSIAKVILAFESGLIAPNINYNLPRKGVTSLEEGRLKVVTDVTPLDGPLVGVNSFGFGGANAHCLLLANSKEKVNNGAPLDSLPRLVNWSGRSEEALNVLYDDLTSRPLDCEQIALMHNIQKEPTTGYVYRGYTLVEHQPNENAKCIQRETQYYPGTKRPIVWVYSGMGSQWSEMATSMMNIPAFRSTIESLHKVMLTKGLDLIKIITDPENKFENILHSFVGIAAIQIAITDILRMLEVQADYYVGHSVGELGCAYGDGTITGEQMILASYSRGMASLETEKIRGAMAAVGLGYQKIKFLVPSTIEVACHNGPDSCTISGPEAEIQKFVAELKSKGIFAKEVACSNIAYHSRYIKDMGPNLLKRLREIIPTPNKRSAKWLSSSVPKALWDLEEAQYSSAEYHTNNLLSSVLFEETIATLPYNSVTLEIAPHGLLQAILKKAMLKAVHVPLTHRGNKTNHHFFLNALGKLFMNGVNMNLQPLYPPVQFPVSRGTPMISHLVRWDHSADWFVTKFELQRTTKSGERTTRVVLGDQDNDYIEGHTIDGRILFPATAYLQLVWEAMGLLKGPIYFDVNVEFEDVRFLRATAMQKNVEIFFTVRIHIGTGRFEVTEGQSTVVTGLIREMENAQPLEKLPELPKTNAPIMPMKDFYKELRLRGYHYYGAFRNVLEARSDGLYGKVRWADLNFVPFMDGLMQIQIIGKDSRSLMLPTRIRKMRINCKEHMRLASSLDPENPYFEVFANRELETLRCGGIEIIGMHANTVPRRKPPGVPVLESYKFISNLNPPILPKSDVARIITQIALENNPILKVKVVENDLDNLTPVIDLFKLALEDLPLITGDLMLLSPNEVNVSNIHVEDGKLSTLSNYLMVIAPKCSSRPDLINVIENVLLENAYLISREPLGIIANDFVVPHGFQLVGLFPTEDETLVLLQKARRKIYTSQAVIKVSLQDQQFEWLNKLKTTSKSSNIILYSQNESISGIIGLVNCLRKEPDGKLITCVFIDDPTAPPFDTDNAFYKTQLQLGLAINVYRQQEWGTYRHLELQEDPTEKPQKMHVYGNTLTKGDLSSLSWVQGPLGKIKQPLNVDVQFAALNFRDVMLSTGRLSVEVFGTNRIQQECILGFEYSGINMEGKRIMGFVLSGALSSQVIAEPELYWEVPKGWTLEQASSVPVVYVTVYSAFFLTTRIQKGKSVLIHAGTGGVGLAAIRVALAYGLEVYTTVSTEEKKQFLLKTYPSLKAENIGNSRDTSFENMIRVRTNGKGVDYVLNSLSEDKLTASIRCLGRRGHFLEIGKFDISNDSKIGLGHFLHEVSFHATSVDNLFSDTFERRKEVYDIIRRDLVNGVIQPLPTTVFNANQIEQAFRFLASGKHIGKVILKIRETAEAQLTLPVRVRPRVYFDPELVYIIPGGLGGFGLELVDWMMTRGCKKFVLSSSKGLSKPYQSYRISIWETYGCIVKVNTDDITTKIGCEKLLKDAQKLGHIGGIFNLAVILQDCTLENQSTEKYLKSLGPKAMATIYLDELSRKMCPFLRYFVVFSSVSCGRGNAGQSNYGMANSIMERIIEQRHSQGLPGKAIQWGAVGEVGLVADMQENKIDMEIGGTLQQRISSCLVELDPLLTSSEPIVASMVVAEKRLSGGRNNPVEAVMNIMGIRDIKSVSMESSLSDMGMDSLMAVEINQTLEREFELFLSPQDLRSLTFAKLQEYAEERESAGETAKLKIAIENRKVGMDMMLRNLGDESTAYKNLVRLETLNMAEKFQCSMVIIPGIEGVAGSTWQEIAGALKMPAFVLQLTNTYSNTDMKSIVDDLKDVVLNDIVKKSEMFYIVGYSFGTFVAMELVKYFEECGFNGKLVLIDGAPKFLKQLAYGHNLTGSSLNDDMIQIMLLTAIANNIFPDENIEELRKVLMGIPSMDKRVEKMIDMSRNQHTYSEKYLRLMATALFNRLKMLFGDIAAPEKLSTQITLIRPSDVAVVEIDEDYELSNHSEQPIQLRFVEGNHSTILENPKLANVLNELDPTLESNQGFRSHYRIQV